MSGIEITYKEFLLVFRDFWLRLCTMMQTYRDVFHYFERTYLMRESHQTLWELALNQVKETLSVFDRD